MAAAGLLAVSLLTSLEALAAGLGKLTVFSALGQPLSAEIEIVSLQPGEEESLSARIAPNEAFRQASIEFNAALLDVRLTVDRQAGKTAVKLVSKQAVNEPFLDMLVELSWNSGRLVREYTLLLDPPGYKGPPVAQAAAPLAPAPAAPPLPKEPEARVQAPIDEKLLAPVVPKPAGTYAVKKGDTLAKIATRTKPEGVTLQQMLIALFRANPDAFIAKNINLVRAGRILDLPDREMSAAVDPDAARRLVAAQAADFRAYRSRLAGAVAAAPAGTGDGQRAVSGKISAQPDAPKAGAKTDQLKLSKAEPAAKDTLSRAARGDDLAAREKALAEAQSRVRDLEKNVQDLQKLLELKNRSLAALEKSAGAKPAAPAPAPGPVPAPKDAAKAPEAPKAPAAPAPQADAVAPAPAAATPAAPAPKPPPEAAAKAPEAPKPAAQAPKPRPKPAAAPPPPPPSLFDEFVDNPVALGGLGAVIVLLAGYGAWAWRRKKAVQSKLRDSMMGGAGAGLGASSVFSGAGETVDTGAPVSPPVSASGAASVGSIEAGEVDPIAEADVYIAYGRDAQAEEILKEALAKDSSRVAVHAKLLEIYAARRDTKSFEQTAMRLKNLSGGVGADWEKAAALGRSIDPQNGMYGEGAPVALEDTAPMRAVAAAAPTLDFNLDAAATAPASEIALGATQQFEAAPPALDFDLGGGDTVTPAAAEKTELAAGDMSIGDAGTAQAQGAPLDFDLGMGETELKPAEASGGLNFELPGAAEPAPAPAASADTSGLDFNFDLNLGSASAAAETPAAQAKPDIDLSSISFDLGVPADSATPTASADARWQEVATKLDLAKAYEEMGDKDGARELLNEVLNEGDTAQQNQARELLAKLG